MGMLPTGAWLFSDPEPLGQPANKEIQALIRNFRFKAEDITSQNTIDVGGEGIKTTWSKASGVPVQARGEEKRYVPRPQFCLPSLAGKGVSHARRDLLRQSGYRFSQVRAPAFQASTPQWPKGRTGGCLDQLAS